MSRCADGWGGGCPGSGGHGLSGGAARAVGLHASPPVFAIRGPGLGLPGVGPDSRQVAASPPPAASAIARGFRRHLRLCLCGGGGCGGGGFLGR